MKIPFSWLSEFVDLEGLDPYEVANRLAMIGTEIESVDRVEPAFENVITARIENIRKHPNAGQLSLCDVYTGREHLEIVCGAKNMKSGDVVPIALVGAKLSGGLQVEKRMIRGVESVGMMCSEMELGIGDDHSGILILDDNISLGKDFSKVTDQKDWILNLEITPNRVDCMNLIGVAREVAAAFDRKMLLSREFKAGVTIAQEPHLSIEVDDASVCPRYTAYCLDDISMGPSPFWVRQRLRKVGVRPINNVVDATNYILFEMGQPMHAFDMDRIDQQKIMVRRARDGEAIRTLDGVLRNTTSDTILITDPSGPIALAGIMGGENTEVSGATRRVVIESANFNPALITRTSKLTGLRTEASTRFEKGLDPNMTLPAAERCACMIAELSGARMFTNYLDVYPYPVKPWKVSVRKKKMSSFLGIEIKEVESRKIFKLLQIDCRDDGDKFELTIPTFRRDLQEEVDVFEEVSRIYSFDRFPSTLPLNRGHIGYRTFDQKQVEVIRSSVANAGLDEVISYSFSNEDVINRMGLVFEDWKLIKLKNPIIDSHSMMRPMLLPGLLEIAAKNFELNSSSIGIFELSKTYMYKSADDELPIEEPCLCLVLCGKAQAKDLYYDERDFDFYDLKGIIEFLVQKLNIRTLKLQPADVNYLHPAVSYKVLVDGGEVGHMGRLNPIIAERFDLPAECYVAELSVQGLILRSGVKESCYQPERFPPVKLDVAMIVNEDVSNEDILEIIKSHAGGLLDEVVLFDIFRGGQIGEGKKSMAYSLSFRRKDRTLREQEALKVFNVICNALRKKVDARIRERT
jgi:phenylalanyl-tRNA synthetase beta chain